MEIPNKPTYNYNYSTEGMYYYTLLVSNGAGCLDSMTQEIYLEFRKALYSNTLYPGSNNFEVANFIPKGTGMRMYKIEVRSLEM